jgi:hypothetical protein
MVSPSAQTPHPRQIRWRFATCSATSDDQPPVPLTTHITEEICAWAEQQLAAGPGLRPAQLVPLIEESFGVRVHPRSVERALARRRERHSKR